MWMSECAARRPLGAFWAGLLLLLAADPSVCSVADDIIDQPANEAAAAAVEAQAPPTPGEGAAAPASPETASVFACKGWSSDDRRLRIQRWCALDLLEAPRTT